MYKIFFPSKDRTNRSQQSQFTEQIAEIVMVFTLV